MNTNPQPDYEKLKELILYLSLKSEGDQHFGATKLNKLLFYSDFLAYRQLGSSITGETYRALPFGPVPNKIERFLSRLVRDGVLAMREEDFYDKAQKRPIALQQPDVTVFSSKEIALVDSILERFRLANATQISAASHQFLGWELAEQGERIPYSVALLGHRELTPQERAYAESLEPRAREWLASRRSR